jgi:hypothetical protein
VAAKATAILRPAGFALLKFADYRERVRIGLQVIKKQISDVDDLNGGVSKGNVRGD